jgi:hypothetical protein
VTFTPSAPLEYATTYLVAVSGAQDEAGNVMAEATWTFTTDEAPAPPGSCPCTLFTTDDLPAVAAANDPSAVELGMKFTADVDGTVTGVRFYKGPGNTGVHVGNLWSSAGVNLGSVTFSAESTTGWQQANFASPVAITAGETYVVSYHAPSGHYSVTGGQFTSDIVRGPLRGLASDASGGNGVYLYGPGGFPTGTYLSGNYWVDVVFSPSS